MTTPLHPTLTRGHLPLLISIPHCGEHLPDALARRMTAAARLRTDTDWHLPRLYGFAQRLGASVLAATVSRYAIDANRPPDGANLYPGQATSALCPLETFRGEPLYDGPGPDAAEIAQRVALYWQPYHDALRAEIDRLRAAHGRVLVWEAHSIATELPRLFEGRLPGLNIGSFSGAACAPAVRDAAAAAAGAGPFSWTVDARFKGGYITRHYGRPDERVHVLQLEMVQSLYMDESAPYGYRDDLAARVLPTLQDMVGRALAALPEAR